MSFTKVSENKCFDGSQKIFTHESKATGGTMRFSVFVPPQAARGAVPIVWWLSGLTCTEENFTFKAGAQRLAAELGLMVVAPDTSPRGAKIPGEDDAYDFGTGAGFYVDATRDPWSKNYRMYSYITQELPALVFDNLPARRDAQGIFGHSMGGHGALVIALRNPGTFRSLSAFAPIVAPSQVPWGHKALGGYLGEDREAWKKYDATELIGAGARFPSRILIDQGSADQFLAQQLKPELFVAACKAAGQAVDLRMREGYDHSYYFIATFIGDHLKHHAEILHK